MYNEENCNPTILSSSLQEWRTTVRKMACLKCSLCIPLGGVLFPVDGKAGIDAKLSETVTSTVNDKINGSLTFSAMDVSLSGKVRIQDPVIRDTQGRTVLSGSDIQIFVNPWKIVASLPDGNPAAAIETVDITKPVVHVWQKPADNTWNVATLIKTSKEKTDSGFRAMVRFHDGTVRARLADGTLITGDGGDGTLDFKSYPAIYGDMTLYVDGEN